MNVVDLVVLVVVGVAAVRGLRLGAVFQVFWFSGLLLGFWLGAVAGHRVAGLTSSPTLQAVLQGATLVALVVLAGWVFRMLGGHVCRGLRLLHAGGVDSVAGVAVGVVFVLVCTWVAAGVLADSGSPLERQVQRSRIVTALDRALPPLPSVVSQLQVLFGNRFLPQVFAEVAPGVASPVALPSGTRVADVTAWARGSVVKVVGDGCGQVQEGSGFIAAPGYVVTNAHVVAGIAHPVVDDPAGRVHATEVVLFDPDFDLAVLRVGGLTGPPLRIDPSMVARPAQGVVLGYPGGGPFSEVPAGVMAAFRAQGRDIYGQGLTLREVYELDAVVRPGNSGGPLVSLGGEVTGVVFSRSATDARVGYALAAPGVLSRLHRAEAQAGPVGTGGCIAG